MPWTPTLAPCSSTSRRLSAEPCRPGSGRFAHLRDPEGNRIELWQRIGADPGDRPGGF